MDKYTLKPSFSTEELFINLSPKLLSNTAVKNRNLDRKVLAKEIFNRCFYKILLDIIDNNVTFVLPLN